MRRLTRPLNVNARKMREYVLKRYNYPKRRRGKPQDQLHQRANARDV
jgi:hypothetical protein